MRQIAAAQMRNIHDFVIAFRFCSCYDATVGRSAHQAKQDTMQLTYSQFIQACKAMREQGIARRNGPLVINLVSDIEFYNPQRFYWDNNAEDTPTQQMIYGPIAHNDNVI